jgi:predicted dehydrogenase
MSAPIRVGLIGVNALRGWAAEAHIPALRALPSYEVTALSTTRQESADAAAAAFGVKLAFDNHHDLVTSPEVDLVVVTVKVAHHREIVEAALKAGKAVYSEWPLGMDLAEAQAMVGLAAQRNARTLIGLQSRSNPAVMFARDLVASGYIGTVLSTTLIGSAGLGGMIDRGNSYIVKNENGASLLRLVAAHSIDVINHVLGDFAELSAVLDTRRPDMVIVESGERIVKTAPDQVAVIGRLESGTTASIHFREGHQGGEKFMWEINGSEGTLQLRAEGGHPGMFAPTIAGSQGGDRLAALTIPELYTGQTPGLEHLENTTAYSVARMYNTFAADLRNGTHNAPNFAQALRTFRVIEAVEKAAASGVRLRLPREI